jgi:hypothetical protein
MYRMLHRNGRLLDPVFPELLGWVRVEYLRKRGGNLEDPVRKEISFVVYFKIIFLYFFKYSV